MHYLKFVLLASMLSAGSAFAQVGGALKPLPATRLEPSNLAEAAGKYIGTVEQLHVLKATRCGYALKRQIPSYEKVVADEILPAFPPQARNEVAAALKGLRQDVTRQGQTLFDNLYMYYTKTEQLDSNTACGFITGGFITMRKLAAEAFERTKFKRP
ncbi:MAG: hypothetical protein K8R50_00015 [Betaproteobacteria bacterium]|nr:hypothetical protein [Betaproteobacteria bacterium]MCX7196158.1 hypothetical protein [Pseudomonadota bacterium]